MDPDSERSTTTRKWWLLAGGIAVFVVAVSLFESLLPTPSESGSTSAEDIDAASWLRPPELHRLDDGGIEIRHDFFRRTTIRLGNEEEEKALFDCLAQGIEQTFADGTKDWDRARVRRETRRVQDECMGLPPRPGSTPEPESDGQ